MLTTSGCLRNPPILDVMPELGIQRALEDQQEMARSMAKQKWQDSTVESIRTSFRCLFVQHASFSSLKLTETTLLSNARLNGHGQKQSIEDLHVGIIARPHPLHQHPLAKNHPK